MCVCVRWNAVTSILPAGRRTQTSGIRVRVQILLMREECGMGFHFISKHLFLNNWKLTRNKNGIQEETFSIFGDPKPGSKFSSP